MRWNWNPTRPRCCLPCLAPAGWRWTIANSPVPAGACQCHGPHRATGHRAGHLVAWPLRGTCLASGQPAAHDHSCPCSPSPPARPKARFFARSKPGPARRLTGPSLHGPEEQALPQARGLTRHGLLQSRRPGLPLPPPSHMAPRSLTPPRSSHRPSPLRSPSLVTELRARRRPLPSEPHARWRSEASSSPGVLPSSSQGGLLPTDPRAGAA